MNRSRLEKYRGLTDLSILKVFCSIYKFFYGMGPDKHGVVCVLSPTPKHFSVKALLLINVSLQLTPKGLLLSNFGAI